MNRKRELIEEVVRCLPRDLVWGFRGGTQALAVWLEGPFRKDLDLWVASNARESASRALAHLIDAVYMHGEDPTWLVNSAVAISARGARGLLDVTFGPLMIGPVVTCPETLVTVEGDGLERRLTGVAAVSDLFLRPILRGRLPSSGRTEEARIAWRNTAVPMREAWIDHLEMVFGPAGRRSVIQLLEGARGTRGSAFLRARMIATILARQSLAKHTARKWRTFAAGLGSYRAVKRGVARVAVQVDLKLPGSRAVADRLAETLRAREYRVVHDRAGGRSRLRRRALPGRIMIGFADGDELPRDGDISAIITVCCGEISPAADMVHAGHAGFRVRAGGRELNQGKGYTLNIGGGAISETVVIEALAGVVETVAHRLYIDNLGSALELIRGVSVGTGNLPAVGSRWRA